MQSHLQQIVSEDLFGLVKHLLGLGDLRHQIFGHPN